MGKSENNINDYGKRTCTSCGVCEVACPFNAIVIQLKQNGFYTPIVSREKCTNCGFCKKVCYKYAEFDIEKNNLLNANLKTYSGYSKNENIRLNSSSGGVSHEIGCQHIEKNKRVIGAQYSYDKNIVEHSIATNKNSLKPFIGSKYLQSYTPKAFRNIENGDLVFGTPCQIYGLRKLNDLKEKKDLLFVDLYCHGTPSYAIWNKYLASIKAKYNIGNIKHINFREKKKTGWHNYSIAIEGENNSYSRTHKKDLFSKMFLNNHCLNHACYTCEFRRNFFPADIRIGDFWGKKYLNNQDGITIITANSKGHLLLNSIKERINLKLETVDDLKDSQYRGNIKIPTNYEKNISRISKMNFTKMTIVFFLIPFLKKGLKNPKIILKALIPNKIISYIKA